ncbi:MAG TPA: NYN domain-containing protein [Polyangiaceae bacterium]|nr:NYN domain-containing protein [Polyangiaceae bacterium]
MREALTRIAVFYDGNFFHVVSSYYAHQHARQARISIRGLHEFIQRRVAHEEQCDVRRCQVVDVHYFRGRFSADEASAANKLYSDRLFDDVLVREGVTTHYLPMGFAGTEKGVDVWFALEAYELAIHKRFDVCVLVAGDSDYLPLVRKLNALGTRVMLVGWDFEYRDRDDRMRGTKTSKSLLKAVTYPVLLSTIIEDEAQQDEVKDLFLPHHVKARGGGEHEGADPGGLSEANAPARHEGTIQNLIVREAEGQFFGFITPRDGGDNLWFGHFDLEGVAFDMLSRGDAVSFESGTNWLGPCAKHVRRKP